MRRARLATWFLLWALAVAACGTRLDHSAFGPTVVASDAVDGQPSGTGSTTGGGSASGTSGSADFSDLGGTTADGGDGPQDTTGATGGQQATATGSAGTSGGAAGDGSETTGSGSTTDGGSAGESRPNEASDVGVFPDRIKVGNIVDKGGALGPDQFTPSYFGANAYFQYVNAVQGGIHGRQVEFITCDSKETKEGSFSCAERLIEDEQVFALVANNLRNYAAASYVSENGVPDIGGQPIGNEYWTYPTLFTILGSNYTRDGVVGEDGTLYNHTGLYHWFATNTGITKAGIFYYSIPISKQQGLRIAESLEEHGVETVHFEINPALPNFDSAVVTMQNEGVDAIFDTMDANANRNLCDSMQRRNFSVKVKNTTVAGQSRRMGSSVSDVCRPTLYAAGDTLPTSATEHPEVKLFNDVMTRVYDGQFDATMHQWHFEGWLAAKMFHDAMETPGLGAAPTRQALIGHFDGWDPGTYGGTMDPTNWRPRDWSTPCSDPSADEGETDCLPDRNCVVVSRWDDAAGDFVMVAGVDNCPTGEWSAYEASA